uniref:ras association domain-containing protein 10 n=1 Tax=Euleptes europaea TaxID=460621 RepID=UPI0025408B37|nr:ras association domain-containing protein 10 [Euleptes europaea]
MEPEDGRISVWICQEEKLVSGLSRRTTCSDVVRALLEDSKGRRRRPGPGGEEAPPPPASLHECGGGLLSGPARSYCLVEKWRGFERTLPPRTKLLRLWAAWGAERGNVRFVLVRSEASLPNAGPRSAEARVVASRESPAARRGPAAGGPALSRERQRRVVRKAFRKLARLNKRRGAPPPPPPPQPPPPPPPPEEAKERMETLVHLVLSQDHTLRQQLQRLGELDREIERREAQVHLERVRRHGANYVQDTYLVGGEAEAEEDEEGGEDAQEEAAAEYGRQCEQLAALQEQCGRQEALLERLAGELQRELNERWMERRRRELEAARGSGAAEADCATTELSGPGGEAHAELERVRTQLSASLYIGLRLATDLDAAQGQLHRARRARDARQRELRSLLDALPDPEAQPEGDAAPALDPPPPTPGEGGLPEPAPVAPQGWGEPAARGLGKGCAENDEDSDTGLSSMHSQDSDSVPVCESLV